MKFPQSTVYNKIWFLKFDAKARDIFTVLGNYLYEIMLFHGLIVTINVRIANSNELENKIFSTLIKDIYLFSLGNSKCPIGFSFFMI